MNGKDTVPKQIPIAIQTGGAIIRNTINKG